ncbi:MAG: hypothetical protein HFI07_12475 [Lachnospiraceae bacterium]|nr:hypothetical protein [Lachnospiraceae bacterium]
MSNYFLYPVLELQSFILLSVGCLFLGTFLCFYFMGRKKKGIRDFTSQAVFFVLSGREQLWFTLHISQICFIAAVVFFRAPAQLIQIMVLGAFCLGRGILEFAPGSLIRELVYGVLMGTALGVCNLLKDYMRETGVEFYIALIWGLLCLFILQYSVYYFLKSLERMLQRHEMADRRRKRNDEE